MFNTMTMRKHIKKLLVVLIIFILASSYGATLFTGKFELRVFYNGENVLNKEYKIKTSTLMTVMFRYGGNFYNFYINNKEKERVLDFSCINDDIGKDLRKVTDRVEKPMINSQIIWNKEKAEFNYIEGENGVKVNQISLIDTLYKELKAKTAIALPVEIIEQKETVTDLKRRTCERGSFSTNYGHSSANRKHNIELAVKKLNGQVIPAKSQLSFNNIVGRRTIENGFKTAGIISEGTFIQGVGGGVCQVSTTLYNAWVRSGLDVINAVNHSLPVTYIGPSFDAMVSSKNDLLLYNNTPYEIYIKAETKDNKVFMTIFGLFSEEKVVLRNEVLRTIPCDEYEIVEIDIDWKENEDFRILKKPINGLVSVAYKDIYVNGKLKQTEKFRINTYAPQKGKMVKKPVINDEERENPFLDPSYSTLFTIVPSLVSLME